MCPFLQFVHLAELYLSKEFLTMLFVYVYIVTVVEVSSTELDGC